MDVGGDMGHAHSIAGISYEGLIVGDGAAVRESGVRNRSRNVPNDDFLLAGIWLRTPAILSQTSYAQAGRNKTRWCH